MVDVLHVPFIFFPDPSGGTEVYVDGLVRALRSQGFEGAVAAPANADAEYDHNEIRVFRFAKTASADLSYAYGMPDERAARSFHAVLGRVRPRIVHIHAHTAAVSELLVDAAHDAGAKVVFTYHTPTVSCARGTMLLMGRSPCDGKIDVKRCSVCVLASHGVPAGLRNLITAMPRGLGEALHTAGMSGSTVTALRIPALLESGYRRFRSMSGKIDCMVAVCEWVRDVLRRNGVPENKIELCRQGLPHGGSTAMPEPAVSGIKAPQKHQTERCRRPSGYYYSIRRQWHTVLL